MEKRELYFAIKEYNRHHTNIIYFSEIANKLGISRQALNQLIAYGRKRGLEKYKDKLEKILPKELFDSILFHGDAKPIDIHKKDRFKIFFDYIEKSRIEKVKWCLSKSMYNNIKNNKLFTQHMHDKVMNKVKEAEEWEKKRNETV